MHLEILILTLLITILLSFGWREMVNHKKSLANLPIRIHINGARGKSSVTRLIAAGLRAGGLRTLAKTTGSAPRVITMEGQDRVIHRLRSASIGEQVRLLRSFAEQHPDVVVMECMAVQPQYQWVAEHKMVQSTIGVITNVRPDHLEEMGPRMSDIAYSLSNTIPFSGRIVTAEHQRNTELKEVATKRGTEYYEVHATDIPREYMNRFPYLEHDENVALAVRVCELAGVERETALEGMISANPDPGALVLWNLRFNGNSCRFLSAFAANDPHSTAKIWNLIDERLEKGEQMCVFLNTRPDRRSRTRQLLTLVADKITPHVLIVRGDNLPANLLTRIRKNTRVNVFPISSKVHQIVDVISGLDRHFIFGIGNMVGWGDEFVTALKRYRVND